jgi:hypothetical protein
MVSSRRSISVRRTSFRLWTRSARAWKTRKWTYNCGPSPSTEGAWRDSLKRRGIGPGGYRTPSAPAVLGPRVRLRLFEKLA